MPVSYQAEKFNLARRALMLPHPKGEAAAVADAFLELSLALHKFDDAALASGAREQLQRLRELMDTSGTEHGSERGAWAAKAKGFSTEDKLEISALVDSLASWFREHGRS
jgi:hypothetical protein